MQKRHFVIGKRFSLTSIFWVRSILSIALLFMLGACGNIPLFGPAFECSDLHLSEFSTLKYGLDTLDSVRKELKDRLGSEGFVETYWESSQLLGKDGKASNYTYEFYFKDGLLLRTNINMQKPSPTGEGLIDCLGPPDYYSVDVEYNEQIWSRLDLWFVSQGIIAHASQPVTSTIDAETEFQVLKISNARDIDALVRSVFLPQLDSTKQLELAGKLKQKLKVWKGDWRKIETPRIE